jgi:hypothetical protein
MITTIMVVCVSSAQEVDSLDTKTIEELLAEHNSNNPTNCASEIFYNALLEHSNEVNSATEEEKVKIWAMTTMQEASVLEQVLKCPELQSVQDTTTIIFNPIVYKFPDSDREITINYSTQPKVLKQHIILSRKRSLPNGEVSPNLDDLEDGGKYIYTDPAWYGILVVQHDSLSEFVGKGANNTVSIKYINDNIDKIYPHGYNCTSRSAWANDTDTINKVVHEVVDIENDTNDYYVAGDINLEWVMYAELAADIIITVATVGGGAIATGTLKSLRATRSAKKLIQTLKGLTKLDDVKKYIEVSRKISKTTEKISKIEKNIKNAKKYEKILKKIEKGTDVAKNKQELEKIVKAAKEIDPDITEDMLKNADKLKDTQKELEKTIKPLEKQAENMVKNSDNVKLYKESSEALTDVMKYRRNLRAFKRPQTGNILTRPLKTLNAYRKTVKSVMGGAGTLSKADSAVRAGISSFSSRLRERLFQSTLKNGARLAKATAAFGTFYGVVTFIGDMYDQTSTTSKEYSNGIEFKPFCLLSADDLEGQDNVVNYGMWLMWVGNSTDPADDDSAYLQAMDFAEKFAFSLNEYQSEHGAECNVDIYVVHPIIRLDETNVNDPKGEMFYLFMNDIPWSTNKQFTESVGDIETWERTQKELESSDPKNKYKKETDDKSEHTIDLIASENSETTDSDEQITE